MLLSEADTLTLTEAAADTAALVEHAATEGATADSVPIPSLTYRPKLVVNLPDTALLWDKPFVNDAPAKELPQYYRETYFAQDTLLHPERNGGRLGIAGDPIPYTIKSDDAIISLLLGCFVIALVGLSQSRRFLYRQAKNLFYEPSALTTEYSETSNEFRIQFFLVLNTCLLLGIATFIYVQQLVDTTYFIISQYGQLAVFSGIFFSWFLLRSLCYWIVNSVFFDTKRAARWFKSLLFVTAAEGVLIFPFVMLLAYYEFSIHTGAIYLSIVIFLSRFVLFYKSYVMFFKACTFRFQIIVYLCALEIVPLLYLWGILAQTLNWFNINV